MAKRPDDLISVAEAASCADRGSSTIRLWVRKGLLSGYKKNPKNKNSALLVSRQELMTHLAVNGKINPPRPTVEAEISSSVLKWEQEKSKMQTMIASLEAEKALMKQMISQNEIMQKHQSTMIEQLIEARKMAERELDHQRKSTAQAEERASRLESKTERLMVYLSLPWWRRWSNAPMLTMDAQ